MNNMISTTKTILNYFFIGVLAVIPVVIILQIILFVKDLVKSLFILVYGYGGSYTVLVFLVSFILFALIGYSTVKYGRPLFISWFEWGIDRIPFLNTIYRVSKKIVGMLSGHGRAEPREIVYVEYPKEGLWVPAYVTNKQDDMYVLFVPTSPNPTSGFTVIVHKSKVIKSEMDLEDASTFIVSIGVDFPRAEEVSKLFR
ncbi:MAG: DUF502 domain-containing protein [Pseudomonadota bacterium]